MCTKDDRVECDMKWEHILKNIQLGPYQVKNVAELLKGLNNTTTVVSMPTIGMFLIITITIGLAIHWHTSTIPSTDSYTCYSCFGY